MIYVGKSVLRGRIGTDIMGTERLRLGYVYVGAAIEAIRVSIGDKNIRRSIVAQKYIWCVYCGAMIIVQFQSFQFSQR